MPKIFARYVKNLLLRDRDRVELAQAKEERTRSHAQVLEDRELIGQAEQVAAHLAAHRRQNHFSPRIVAALQGKSHP